MKLLFTIGIDAGFDENGEMSEKAYVIKLWDFTQLVSGSCKQWILFSFIIKSFQMQSMEV